MKKQLRDHITQDCKKLVRESKAGQISRESLDEKLSVQRTYGGAASPKPMEAFVSLSRQEHLTQIDNGIAIPTGNRYCMAALFRFCDLRIKRKATESMTLWPFFVFARRRAENALEFSIRAVGRNSQLHR